MGRRTPLHSCKTAQFRVGWPLFTFNPWNRVVLSLCRSHFCDTHALQVAVNHLFWVCCSGYWHMLGISVRTPVSSSSEREACHEWRCGAGGRGHGTGDRWTWARKRQEGTWDSHVPQTAAKTSCQPPGAHSDSCSAHNHACIGDKWSLSAWI